MQTLALTDEEIKQNHLKQVNALDLFGWKITGICAFCGQNTTVAGSDCHRACWDHATFQARRHVLGVQVKAQCAQAGLPWKLALIGLTRMDFKCRDCSSRWSILEQGWECPRCVNV